MDATILGRFFVLLGMGPQTLYAQHEDWKTYLNPENGFSIDYPADFFGSGYESTNDYNRTSFSLHGPDKVNLFLTIESLNEL